MPVPADSVAPFAVLVLAWDETLPAVRTLLAAVQADTSPIDSILMMVPQAEAPEALSAEEYLPLPTAAVVELLAQLADPPLAPAEMQETDLAALAAADPDQAAIPSALPPPAQQPDPTATAEASETPTYPATGPLAETVAPTLAWAAVRVLRLSSFSLSELAQQAGQPLPAPTWTAPAAVPAAPYLGATAPLASQQAPAPRASAPALPPPHEQPGVLASQPASAAPLLTSASLPTTTPTYLAAEAAALAPDLEADAQPTVAEELASFELAYADLLPADDSLPIAELAPAGPLPEQAGWPEALAALHQVAPLAEPDLLAAATDEPAGSAAELAPLVRASTRSYAAPDLNFQVIQYARFAVPLALADPDFEAIYAPAWPTWLAAQELRQRTGRPLVLHVVALAAPAAEPLDTAAGWVAELQRQALRRADLVLAETAALAHRLRHELGLPASAVRTIAAADAAAIAQALRAARPRPKVSPS